MEIDNIGNVEPSSYNVDIDTQLKDLSNQIKLKGIESNKIYAEWQEYNLKNRFKIKNNEDESKSTSLKLGLDYKQCKIELDYLNNEFSRIMELSFHKKVIK